MLINHIEKYLGTIQSGSILNDGKYDIQVALFKDQPFEGIHTFSTIGMSNYPLQSKGQNYNIELLFCALPKFNSDDILSFLLSFSEFLVNQGRAPLRGEYIGPSEPLTLETKMNSVYFSLPAFWEEEFQVIKNEKTTTIFIWLIPLYEEEATFIKDHSWTAFEDLLEKKEVANFWDLQRASFV